MTRRLALYVPLAIMAVVMLGPFAWMLSGAFKTERAMFAYPPQWVPNPPTTDNFVALTRALPFGPTLTGGAFKPGIVGNTFVMAIAITAGQVATSALAAYAFARLRFPGRDAIFLLYLAALIVPLEVRMVPIYLLVRQLGWLDTYQGLIVPQLVTAYGTFLLRQFFLTLPRELEDAAWIDGASRMRTFRSIVLPLSGPALATLGAIQFTTWWTAFLWPLIITTGKLDTLTLNVALNTFRGSNATQWGPIMAGSTLAVLPIVVVYLLAQRYFVQGIQLTGLGGR
ncbi:MAG: carbohydrate ABC transporter permease [Chloroflexota bacterium]|nr:carbohydrate ABC transporter permease [Chloroflexota bacterium]